MQQAQELRTSRSTPKHVEALGTSFLEASRPHALHETSRPVHFSHNAPAYTARPRHLQGAAAAGSLLFLLLRVPTWTQRHKVFCFLLLYSLFCIFEPSSCPPSGGKLSSARMSLILAVQQGTSSTTLQDCWSVTCRSKASSRPLAQSPHPPAASASCPLLA